MRRTDPRRKSRRLAAQVRAKARALETALAEPHADNSAPVSPLAPACFPALPIIAGARFATIAAGVKYKNRDDVMLAVLDPGAVVAGVFTRSSTRSAPVLDCEAKLARADGTEAGAAILVNAGNANAFTGRAGTGSVEAVTGALAKRLSLPKTRIFTSSTGVIGEPLPHDRIVATFGELAGQLTEEALPAAAGAIMTTDTFPKGAAASVRLGETDVKVAGIAKGSGMIAPDMATMLVYIFTDAAITQPVLQDIVSRLNARSFNAITVDGDTSTSDTLLCAATGQAGNTPITASDTANAAAFEAGLSQVMHDLALQVVRDGEGATKLIEVQVEGAVSNDDAWRVAHSIANSPLVKTAAAGEDPNWGRVVMAVGKSGAVADRDRLAIRFGDIAVAEQGWVAPSYSEEAGAAYMTRDHIVIGVDLGLGSGTATVWTCDLTKRYIEINADYRS